MKKSKLVKSIYLGLAVGAAAAAALALISYKRSGSGKWIAFDAENYKPGDK